MESFIISKKFFTGQLTLESSFIGGLQTHFDYFVKLEKTWKKSETLIFKKIFVFTLQYET